jgi:hypothetical protein
MIQPRRIKSALAAALALSAITASSAAARPAVYSPPGSDSGTASICTKVCSGAGYSTHHTSSHSVAAAGTAASGDDFDWGDAAIGAGGAVVILLVGAGGVRAATLHRSHGASGMDVTAAS